MTTVFELDVDNDEITAKMWRNLWFRKDGYSQVGIGQYNTKGLAELEAKKYMNRSCSVRWYDDKFPSRDSISHCIQIPWNR